MTQKKRRKDIVELSFETDKNGAGHSIVSFNGQKIEKNHELSEISVFPDWFIEEMSEKYTLNKEIYGELASKILIYRDKLTNLPKIIMNHNFMIPFEKDDALDYAFGRLSHASRNDAFRQIEIRKMLFNKYQDKLEY